MTPYLILAGWSVFILVLWALLIMSSREDDDAELEKRYRRAVDAGAGVYDEEQAECPYCFDWHELTGPDNVFLHIMTQHPESTIARRIHKELAA